MCECGFVVVGIGYEFEGLVGIGVGGFFGGDVYEGIVGMYLLWYFLVVGELVEGIV